MRKHIWTAVLFLALVEVFSVLPLRVKEKPTGSPPFVTGIIHFPLGKRSVPHLDDLASAAKRANLDFLVLANLDKPIADSVFGNHGGVDFYPEIELSTPAGHGLLFYSQTSAVGLSVPKLKELAWNHFLGTESRPGLFLVIAHPSSVFTPWERLDRFPDGLELINLRSVVERKAFSSPVSFGLTVLAGPFNPYLAALKLYDPDLRDIQGWDAMNAVTPGHFAVMATDDLSDWPVLDRLGIPIPPWDQTLAVASNVVFPEGALGATPKERRSQIYRAIREGRSALLLSAVHPFDGNDWALICGKKEYRSGDKFALREAGCEFVIKTPETLPYRKRVVLWREGKILTEIDNAQNLERIPVKQDGAYRLEVWVQRHSAMRILLNREVPYLIYNPLYVR